MCCQILDLADRCGARTVAEGVETRADFLAVREMGFDLVQGFLFAKPVTAKKFARTILAKADLTSQLSEEYKNKEVGRSLRTS